MEIPNEVLVHVTQRKRTPTEKRYEARIIILQDNQPFCDQQ